MILKALDKHRELRYQSAGELGVDLARLLPISGETGKVAITEFRPAKRRKLWATWLAIAVVVLGCAYGGYHLGRKWLSPNPVGPKLMTVLPFDSGGQDERTNALIVGLTDTLTARLAETGDQNLQVISARDIRAGSKNNGASFSSIWLRSRTQGSVHSVGDQIRIICSLVDSKTHRQLNASTITADSNNALALEDKVANEVTSLIASVQGVQAQTRLSVRTKSNPEAYASYL